MRIVVTKNVGLQFAARVGRLIGVRKPCLRLQGGSVAAALQSLGAHFKSTIFIDSER